jgi:iron(III) transport system ATP-binding protein
MGDANRVRGTLERVDDRFGDLALGPLTVRLPHRNLPAGTVEVAIRPEAVEIGAQGNAGLAGTVRKAAYIGGVMEYTIATDIGELFVISMAVDRPLAPGAPVSLTLAHHGVVPIAVA